MDANMGVDEGVKFERRYRKSDLYPGLFKDNRLSVGGKVKHDHSVLKEHSRRSTRAPNLTCRIETFGRICKSFDKQKRNWVIEIGFGGLLNIPIDLQLPRQLGYWLMTRIDPISRKFIGGDGTEFRFSKNQLHWVFGIPNGG